MQLSGAAARSAARRGSAAGQLSGAAVGGTERRARGARGGAAPSSAAGAPRTSRSRGVVALPVPGAVAPHFFARASVVGHDEATHRRGAAAASLRPRELALDLRSSGEPRAERWTSSPRRSTTSGRSSSSRGTSRSRRRCSHALLVAVFPFLYKWFLLSLEPSPPIPRLALRVRWPAPAPAPAPAGASALEAPAAPRAVAPPLEAPSHAGARSRRFRRRHRGRRPPCRYRRS